MGTLPSIQTFSEARWRKPFISRMNIRAVNSRYGHGIGRARAVCCHARILSNEGMQQIIGCKKAIGFELKESELIESMLHSIAGGA